MLLSQLLDGKGHAVYSIAPGASVIDAIRSMADNHVGALLVLEGQQIVGIVSERDYARKVILLGRSSATTAVRDIMSSPVFTIGAEETVDDAMRLMTERRIRHLPVLRSGKLIGVLSIGDLVKCVIEDQMHTIEDLRSYIRG
ncbi:MAG TPA: CBS domain-containing protein [Steroidobacteraceae bacterium]|nr:CBS domain-containing protein [Steroidobacteraceae bacterium]